MKKVICSICSANYLPQAVITFRSLREHNPDVELALLIAEDPECIKHISLPEYVTVYNVSEIGLDNWKDMAFWYNVIEFNTALKPSFLLFLLKKGFQNLIFVDPDIKAFSPFNDVYTKLKTSELILTPHFTKPILDDGHLPLVEHIMAAGIYNLGFIALRKTEKVEELLSWWKSMLYKKCLHQYGFGYFVDQFFAGAFPALTDNHYILRSESYNAAWWNCFQRSFHYIDDRWETDDGPLVFFHFSQISADDLEIVTQNQSRSRTTKDSALYKLLGAYTKELKDVCKEYSYSDFPYSFHHYKSQQIISSGERALYRNMSQNDKAQISDPFQSFKIINAKFIQKERKRKMKKALNILSSLRRIIAWK